MKTKEKEKNNVVIFKKPVSNAVLKAIQRSKKRNW